MDRWLEARNEQMTADMKEKFGDIIHSAGYYFDMEDLSNPGFIDVQTTLPLDYPELVHVRDYLAVEQGNIAADFKKQPFANTDTGFVRLQKRGCGTLEEDRRAVLHTRDYSLVPDDYYQREITGGEEDSYQHVLITRQDAKHYTYELTVERLTDCEAITPEYCVDAYWSVESAKVTYTEDTVCAELHGKPRMGFAEIASDMQREEKTQTAERMEEQFSDLGDALNALQQDTGDTIIL